MSALIEAFGGDDGFRQMVLSRIGDGEDLTSIAGGFGCTRSVMWSYIKGTEGMLEAYHEAQEAAAEGMACEVVGIADGTDDAKLRIDTRMRLAKAWSPKRYGDGGGATVGGFGGITIVIGDVKPVVEDLPITGDFEVVVDKVEAEVVI